MSNLKNELLVAYQKGDFLQAIYDRAFEEGSDIVLADELVSIHNDGLFDVISCFRALKKEAGTGGDFFVIRHILEKALPNLKASVLPVMDCVLHLTREAGRDMAAATLFPPYIAFCAADSSRPKESLMQIEASADHLADLLIPTIIAGARVDTEYYLNEAIRLTGHENIEIRKRAICSLGRIQFDQELDLCESALTCLEISLHKETDDQLLSNIIESSFSLYKQDKSLLERTINIIKCALSQDGDYRLHVASALFCSEITELPNTLLNILLTHLKNIRPQNKGTIENLDYGLAKLLDQEENKSMELLENILLANPTDLTFSNFSSVARTLIKNKDNILDRLMTRWFQRGDRVLCEGIYTIVTQTYNHNILLSANPSELKSSDPRHILFLARKAIGYLFSMPVTAASIILSLIQHTTEDTIVQQLTDLLFDPLLINYPGMVNEFLVQQKESGADNVKSAAKRVLKDFDDYLNDLKSTGEIPELHPSQAQRDAHRRYFSRLMSESMKEAVKESVLLSILPKSVLLYGRKSISYVYDSDGQPNRREIPLSSHSTEMEVPRREIIDSFSLDYMLRIFRAESMNA